MLPLSTLLFLLLVWLSVCVLHYEFAIIPICKTCTMQCLPCYSQSQKSNPKMCETKDGALLLRIFSFMVDDIDIQESI